MNIIKLGWEAFQGKRDDDSCSLQLESDINMNELIIDLPNLTSITSDGSSFQYPRSITLSSLILNELWIDIPILQTVSLPDSFEYVIYSSIESTISIISLL